MWSAIGTWIAANPGYFLAIIVAVGVLLFAARDGAPPITKLLLVVTGRGIVEPSAPAPSSGPTVIDTSRFLTRDDIENFVTQEELELHLTALRFEMGRLETTVERLATDVREHREDYLVASTEVRGTLSQICENIRVLTLSLQTDSSRLAKQVFEGMRDVEKVVEQKAMNAIDARLNGEKKDS